MPRAPLVIEAGVLFAEAKNGYLKLLDLQAKANEAFRSATSLVEQLETQAETLENQSQVIPYIEEATAKLREAEAIVYQIAEDRILAIMRAVNSIGTTIPKLREMRKWIEVTDPSDFDLRFERLQMRYESVYRPMFPVNKGGVITKPDPRNMTAQDWDRVYTHLEGPIFLWDITECEANWVVAGVPRCTGPDYFESLSMINQMHEWWQTEIEIWRDFPILSFYDTVLQGLVKRVAEHLMVVEKIADAIGRITKAGLTVVAKAAGAVADIAESIAKTPGWVLLAVGAGVFILLRGDRRG